MNIRNQFSEYNTRYVITQDGTTYALVVTDTNAMNNFLQNYPPYQALPNVSPNFPNKLFYESSDVFTIYNGDKAMALSYILDKYKAGITLIKSDSAGNFKKINVTENIINGSNNYTQTTCP